MPRVLPLCKGRMWTVPSAVGCGALALLGRIGGRAGSPRYRSEVNALAGKASWPQPRPSRDLNAHEPLSAAPHLHRPIEDALRLNTSADMLSRPVNEPGRSRVDRKSEQHPHAQLSRRLARPTAGKGCPIEGPGPPPR